MSEYMLKSEEDIEDKIEKLKLKGKTHKKGPIPNRRTIRICTYCRAAFIVSEYDVSRGCGIYCSTYCLTQSNKIKKPSKKLLLIDYESGLSTNDIAEKYKISKGTVYNLFKKHKIEGRSNCEALKRFFKTEKGYKSILKQLETKQKKYNTLCFGGNSKLKSGYKKDLDVSVRSGWEANVLRYLNHQGIKWEYEPKTFFFDGERRGARAYMPDIWLPNKKIWIEVKGWLRSGDRGKIKKFKKFYPEEFEKLQFIVKKEGCKEDIYFKSLGLKPFVYYDDLNKKYSSKILLWE